MVDVNQLLKIDEAWDALPNRMKANSAIEQSFQNASFKLAVVMFKDFFWQRNPTDHGLWHARPDEQLLALMSLCGHQSNPNAAEEWAFWKRIFAS